MWFKQLQLFQLPTSLRYAPDELAEKLLPFAFSPCLPSFHSSQGWSAPLEDDQAPLVHAINGYMMICMQIEEKILPASVIRQELKEKIKKIEAAGNIKIRQNEKLALKDEVVCSLLPRAFTKMTRVYAFIDTRNHWLVLNTVGAGKTEQFLSLFRKTVTEDIRPFELKKLSPVITQWLKTQQYPTEFAIEKACVLQDPNQQSRIIRCQQQDLFASSIQSFIKDGCEIKQLAMSWQDRVNFMLSDDFSLRSLRYLEDVLSQANEIETETRQQQFDADFFIMSETLCALLQELLALFIQPKAAAKVVTEEHVEAEVA